MAVTPRQVLFVVVLLATGAALALLLDPRPRPSAAPPSAPPPPPPPPPVREVVVITRPVVAATRGAGAGCRAARSREAHLATLHRNAPPSPYARVGLLYRAEENGNPDAPAVLPLYGRPTNWRAINYNYRSKSDTLNGVALNVLSKGDDCTNDDHGCDELFDGDVVEVRPYGRYRVDIDRD